MRNLKELVTGIGGGECAQHEKITAALPEILS